MTPLQIEILFHCNHGVGSIPHKDAPAQKEATELFFMEGLIVRDLSHQQDSLVWSTTEKGKAFVRLLCSIEPPKQAWFDSDGEIIE